MARQGNKSKLPAKATAASKAVGVVNSTIEAGFVVIFQGEEIVLKQQEYGSFKKLLHAAIEMQNKDPHFSWEYFDKLP